MANQKSLISGSFQLLKFTSYCCADILSRLLGIISTESGYEIWKGILRSSLNEFYDPQIKATRIAEHNEKMKIYEKLAQDYYKVYMLPAIKKRDQLYEKLAQDYYKEYMLPGLRKEWKKQDLIRQRNERIDTWFIRETILIVILFSTLYMSDLVYMWLKKCILEKRFAEANNKLPKLKYLGSKGKIIKNLIGHNIGEIQIGIANNKLIDLYFPVKKQLYISAPNIEYSRKDLQLIKPIIKSLNTFHYRKYGKY